MKPQPPRLLLITDHSVCTDLTQAVAAALAGGVRHVLLRMKGPNAHGGLPLWAERLHGLCVGYGADLLISGDIEVALSLPGVGLHLPEKAMDTASARRVLGASRLLGRSCHDLGGAVRAMAEGADYVTLSPLFATRSHPDAEPLGVAGFSRICDAIPGPVLALGGIEINNLDSAMQTGAWGVALIRGVIGQPDPEKAAKQFMNTLSRYGAKQVKNGSKS